MTPTVLYFIGVTLALVCYVFYIIYDRKADKAMLATEPLFNGLLDHLSNGGRLDKSYEDKIEVWHAAVKAAVSLRKRARLFYGGWAVILVVSLVAWIVYIINR